MRRGGDAVDTGVPAAIEVRAAYQRCELITKSQARNFSYGIRLLPADKRGALSAVYAFARRVDDIGDGSLPAADKLAALTAARSSVTALGRPGGRDFAGDPVLVALADAVGRFAIPLGAFGELIDGCEADVLGTRYGTFGDLEHYCRCVAGSIGRLSLGIFGCQDTAVAAPLADALGVALQLTNILRDIREDFGTGRVYLPAEDLERFGAVLVPDGTSNLPADSRLEDVIRFEAERARGWYATGLQLMPLLDRRSAASAGAMAGIYFRLLAHISASPAAALQRRLSLSTGEKVMVAARALAGRNPGAARPARAPARAAAGPAGRAERSAADGAIPVLAEGAIPALGDGAIPAPGGGGMSDSHSGTVTVPRSSGPGAAGDGRPARRVVVIGGGLAGITAAIALRESGIDVTLFEARPRLGGATSSFSRDGLMIDNGQHVFLRCCSAYRGLLARLGMTGSATIQDRFDITVLSPRGTARLRRTALPGPLQMGRALAGYSLLSPAERLQVGRAALAMRFLDPAKPGLDSQRLGDWLAARGQGEHARRKLWDLFIVSALNIAGDDASLALAATVVKMALLGARDAADIGVPAVPLGELHGTAAAGVLQQLGAEVRLATTAVAIDPRPGGGLTVRFAAGADRAESSLAAEGVVVAVPPGPAARLMPAAAGGAPWAGLGSSPIVNVHVIYDRRVTRLPFAAGVDSPVQWVFDKTGPAGLETGQYLAVSLSAADDYIDVPAARLREQFVPAIEELLPAAREARITDFFVTRERQATFRQAPGCGQLRPPAATSLPGLVLAGAWTDTGWPDTMEGAVRSGLNAARELRHGLAWPRGRELVSPVGAAAPAGAGAPS
jgi:squalene synthase HpnD